MPARRPAGAAKPPRLPRFSPTRLSLYATCPRAYAFFYDDGLRWGFGSAGQSFGASVHRTLQAFHARGGPTAMSREDLARQLDASWSAAGYGSDEEAAGFRAEGARLLDVYYEQAARDTGRQTIAIEATFQHKYDEFVLFGKIDRLDRRADGALEVIDYKAGHREASEADVRASLPMTVYQVLVARQYPGEAVSTGIFNLRAGTSAFVLRSAEEIDDAERDVCKLARTVLADNVKAATPGDACRDCAYPRICPPGRAWLRENGDR